MPSSQFERTAETVHVAVNVRNVLASRNAGPLSVGVTTVSDGAKSLKTSLGVHRMAMKWHHKVTPSKRLKKHAESGRLSERPVGDTLNEAVDLVDASVAHQRRIRTLFSELETKQNTREEVDTNEEEKMHPDVQAAWHGSRTQEIRVSKKMNELRDDHEYEDSILPIRTIQQVESYLLSSVAILKSYMTTGARVTATEILGLMSQITFAAVTTEELSHWAGEALEMLGRERERAHAIHRENARVSREAMMAQKEILSLEAKVFHAGKEVESMKAYAGRLKAESGDMRAVMSAIKDSVMAAGLAIVTHDENGDLLSASQAAFSMIKKLRETSVGQQDKIGKLQFFVDKGKLDLEKAEMMMKHMKEAASSKHARKKAAAAAAAKARGKGAYGTGTGSGGGKGGSQLSPTRGNHRGAAASLAGTAAVPLSPTNPAAILLEAAAQDRDEASSQSSSSLNTGTVNSGGGSTAAVAPDSSRAGTRGGQSYGHAAASGSAVDRDHTTAVSVSASTAVDSYDDRIPDRSREGRGKGRRATVRNNSPGGSGQSRERRRTQAAVAAAAAAAPTEGTTAKGGGPRPGEENGVGASLSPTADRRGRSRGASASPATARRRAAAVDGAGGNDKDNRQTWQEERTGNRPATDNQQDLQQQQQQDGRVSPAAGSGGVIKEQKQEEDGEDGEDGENNGGVAERTGGSNKPPDEGSPAQALAPQAATMAKKGAASGPGQTNETTESSPMPQQQQPPVESPPESVYEPGGERGQAGSQQEQDYNKKENSQVTVAPPLGAGAAGTGEQGEKGEEEDDDDEEDEEDLDSGGEALVEGGGGAAIAAPTVAKANRHAKAAVKGLEESLKSTLGTMAGVDAAVMDQLSAVLRSQVALLQGTIRRDMQEVAEDISASAAAETLGMTTELAKREARITQLGSRIEDLQTRLVAINEAHGAELKSLNDLAAEGRKRRQEQQGESDGIGSTGDGEASFQFPPPSTSPQQEQQQEQQRQHPFVPAGEGGQDPSIADSGMRSAWNGEGEHNFSDDGGGGDEEAEGGRGATEDEELGKYHRRHPWDHQHQHQHQPVDRSPERISGRGEGETLRAHFGDVVGGRPRSVGAVGGGVHSSRPMRTPVDGGEEQDAHWEASQGIGSLRRGKSAGTFFLGQQQQRPPSSGGGLGRREGRGGTDRTAGAAAAAGEGDHQARDSTGGCRDSSPEEDGNNSLYDSRGRAQGGTRSQDDDDSSVTGFGPHAEDQQTMSVLTEATHLAQNSAGETVQPLSQQQQQQQQRGPGERRRNGEESHPGNPKRQENEELSRAADGGGGGASSAPPQGLPGHTAVPTKKNLTPLPASAPTPAPAPAPATSLKEMQGRAKIQHMPKALGDVVVAAAAGSSVEGPETARRSREASTTATLKTARHAGDEGGRSVEARDVVAKDETVVGDESDGDEGDNKHQQQQRALRAFLQGADETQANLAFVALRQEPFLVEEFEYLANQIRDLHEATNGAAPRHLPHGELRDRLRELSSRSVPLLRRVRARYRRLHARWASKLLGALSTRGLSAGDADVSLTCSLCGYDWRRAQPRGTHRRPAFHGMKRGNTPGRVRGALRRNYQQQRRHQAEATPAGGSLSKRDVAQHQRLLGPAIGGEGGVVVPGVAEDWQDKGNGGSFLQVGAGGVGSGGDTKRAGTVGLAGRSLLSEESLFLHSLSAPTVGGIGGALRSGSGRSVGDSVSSMGSRSALSKAEGGAATRRRDGSTPRETQVALPPLAN